MLSVLIVCVTFLTGHVHSDLLRSSVSRLRRLSVDPLSSQLGDSSKGASEGVDEPTEATDETDDARVEYYMAQIKKIKQAWKSWADRKDKTATWASWASSRQVTGIIVAENDPIRTALDDDIFQGYALDGDDKVLVAGWGGRTGNWIRAIKDALIIAISNPQYRQVCMADPPDGLADAINNNANGGCIAVETAIDSVRFRYTNASYTYEDLRLPALKYIRPILSDTYQSACARTPAFDGLTVHLRAGDLLGIIDSGSAALAPCSYIDFVIEKHGYRAVKIVTEPGFEHPCVNTTVERHSSLDVTFQSGAVEEDACILMMAKHVLHSTYSTFSTGFGWLLNANLETVHYPYTYAAFKSWGACGHYNDVPDDPQCVDGGTAYAPAYKIYRYDIDNIYDPRRSEEDKIAWMKSNVGVREAEEQCNYNLDG